MQWYFLRALMVVLVCLVSMPHCSQARVLPQKYGTSFSAADSAMIVQAVRSSTDSMFKTGRLMYSAVTYSIQPVRPLKNLTPDFYLLTGLGLILGAIRYSDPRYFMLLIGAYRGGGSRQWRDMIQAAALPNLGMNLFFTAVAGAYIYYLTASSAALTGGYRAPLVLLVMIVGMQLMYAAKYAVIRFSGWAFRVEGLAEDYLFNVFLVNKIIGIVLLPFVVIIAFAGRVWLQPMAIVSGTIVLGLLTSRYLRSWPALYAFFKGSRFHFFTYLCASEILPMAVLVKWLLHVLR